jgi:hypothetical protein
MSKGGIASLCLLNTKKSIEYLPSIFDIYPLRGAPLDSSRRALQRRILDLDIADRFSGNMRS